MKKINFTKKIFIFFCLFPFIIKAQSIDKSFTIEVVPKQPMSINQLNYIVGSITPQSNIVINTTKSNENFIASESITLLPGANLIADISLRIEKMELINESFLSSIKYFDGLGRPIQNISIGQSPEGKDIVNHYEYDQFGRTEKSYLPLPSNQNTGNFISNPVSQINSYYQITYGDTNPYSQQRFDNSPLSKVVESAQPGNEWKLSNTSDNDHTLKREYNVNEENEVYRFNVESDSSVSIHYYDKGELMKNISKNENWSPSDGLLNTKDFFSDKNGRKIAEFRYLENNGNIKKLATYYVYDNIGNLKFILPPKLTNTFTNTSNYNDYSTSWAVNDFLEQGDAGITTIKLSITNNILRLTTETNSSGLPSKILKPQTVKILNTVPSLPNMFLGQIKGTTGLTDPSGNLVSVYLGDARIENGNLVIDREISTKFIDLYILNLVDLNSTAPTINQEELNSLAYQYKHDKYNRQIAQKMPGKEWQYAVFDQLDRPILTQDHLLKSLNQWMFTKYDVFGRAIYSGKFTSSLTQEQLQFQVDSFINSSNNKSNIENRTQTTNGIGGVSINYSNNAFPNTNILEITSVNYYDDYSFVDSDKPIVPTSVLGQVVTNKTKGLPTASWSKTIGENTWTKSYPFYDHKTQEIKVVGKNHLSGSNIVETEIDFTGKVKRVITNHKRESSSSNLQITDRFEYDHVGRLTNQYQQINNQEEERISGYVYNELGELTDKQIGGKSNNTIALQEVEYTRNIRGWLEQLNNPNQNLGNDLFAFEAKYNDPNSGIDPLYSGTITGVNWKSSINNNLKTYDYQYDPLGRLSNATFSSNTVGENNRFNVSNLNYDLNGNITSLYRNGWQNSSSYTNMDNLAYEYEGNQLTKVTDTGNNQYGFKDSNTTDTIDYEYDANGNLIRDHHKRMSINYNYLNLPSKITFDSGEVIDITYNSTGAKLSKTYTTQAGATKTEYLGGFQYTNSQLQFFGQAEGFVYKVGSSYKYAYVYTDHIGNNRLSYSDLNGNNTIETSEVISNTDYYPFGLTHFGELQTSITSENKFKFQGKELQEEGELNQYDFGSRIYDPSLGRWFAVDPQGQFGSPYLAMGNNPVMMVDPDGEFSFLAILIGAFVYTAYDAAQGNINNWGDFFESLGQGAAQSALAGYDNPTDAAFGAAYSQFNSTATGNSKEDGFSVSFNPTYSYGSNFGGWGLNASVNLNYGNFQGAFGYGFTNYGKFDVDKGHRTVSHETRLSYSIGWNDGSTGLGLYTTKFNDNLGGQRVGGLNFTSGKFGFRYENDGFPFQYIGLGDGGDSYRTAALQISWEDFSYGFNLFTGYRTNYNGDDDKKDIPLTRSTVSNIRANDFSKANLHMPQYGETYPHGYVNEEGPKYRFGAQYLSYKGYRLGWNSERNRHLIQNLRAHNIAFAKQPGFIMTHNNSTVYFQYSSYNNPYTLW